MMVVLSHWVFKCFYTAYLKHQRNQDTYQASLTMLILFDRSESPSTLSVKLTVLAIELRVRQRKEGNQEWLLRFLAWFSKLRSSVGQYLAHKKGSVLIHVFWNWDIFSVEILTLPKMAVPPVHRTTSIDCNMMELSEAVSLGNLRLSGLWL